MKYRLPRSASAVAAVLTLFATLSIAWFAPRSDAAPLPTVGANGQDTLFFVGDSLTVGTKAFGNLQQRLDGLNIWSSVVINSKVGRRTDQSLNILETKMPVSTTAIVLALGTNDVISRREPAYPAAVIEQVMHASQGLPVLWVNTDFSPTGRGDWRFRSRRFNRALRDAQAEWPNLEIADWYTFFTPRGKARFIADGVHLSVSGYKLRAQFTESQVRKFGNRIVDATTTTTTSLAPSTTTTTVSPTTTFVTPAPPTTAATPTTTTP